MLQPNASPPAPCLKRLSLLCAVVLLAASTSSGQQADPAKVLRSFESTLTNVIEQVEPSVVAVMRSPAPAKQDAGAELGVPKSQREFQPGELQALDETAVGDPAIDPLERFRRSLQGPSEPRVTGAGVVIGEGLVLTQYLVVKPGDRHTVATIDGDRLPAEVIGADPRSSLAVLRVRGGRWKPFELGEAEALRKGSLVVAVANPFAIASDGQPTASYGMVANTAQAAPLGENLNNETRVEQDGEVGFRTTLHHLGSLIQVDARLGWNASGGALVTLDGKLVGLTTTVSEIAGHEKPAGYAIPMNKAIRRAVAALKEGREVEYGLLGITFQQDAIRPLTQGGFGVAASEIYAGSAADRAGMKVGDVVASVAGMPTPDPDALQLVVGSLPPGEVQPIVFERAGKPREAEVRLDKIYVAGEKVVTKLPPSWQGIRVDYATSMPPEQFRSAFRMQSIDPAGCVLVAEVTPDSLSWRQGVRPGMFISHVSGQRVATPEQFRNAIREADGSVKLRFTAGNPPEPAIAPAIR